ncbi:MAG: ATP-binding protein [Candidatus Omnitrophica bacterium]|nr:ATP-binding protein [Candidatus Omnitrophota bacterium]MBU1894466.1 ATP-binding protein [Candidatus Omnitrophota bacterium]
MIISVASGKGGTGKTTIAVNLALSINDGVQFLDCDAEEPNAHIFLKPEITETEKVFIPVPVIDEGKCIYCGRCREVCAYNAIAVIKGAESKKGGILVFSNLCHGCGSCSYFCPEGAIKEVNKEIGEIEIGTSGAIQFIHGRLNIGEAMAPPVIRQIKKHVNSMCTVIIDAPPGTSCPVVETIKRSDFCLLVTEPTPFGLNDLTLAVEVLRKLRVPFGVVINRSDLGNKKTDEYCEKENIPILMRIPFKKEIAVAYSKGEPIVKMFPEYQKDFKELFNKVRDGKFS